MIENEGLLVASRLKVTRKLDSNLYEIRSRISINIQRVLYFHVVGNDFVITHGFTKKTQKTPKAQIEHAKEIRLEFKRDQGS